VLRVPTLLVEHMKSESVLVPDLKFKQLYLQSNEICCQLIFKGKTSQMSVLQFPTGNLLHRLFSSRMASSNLCTVCMMI